MLRVAPRLVEPDDYAYRAWIVAMTQGHFLTLSGSQAQALARALGGPGDDRGVLPQWVQLRDGRWISEKDPGYPFLAAVPGAWHHPVGAAVLRRGCLRGVVRRCPALARALRRRGGRRPVLLVRRRAERRPFSAVAWWLAWVVVFGAGVAVFDGLVYGGPLTSGYRLGEISFGFSAIAPNLRYMPARLLQAMPVLVLGLVSPGWIIERRIRLRRASGDAGCAVRRDLWVGLALAASWFAVWSLYSASSRRCSVLARGPSTS